MMYIYKVDDEYLIKADAVEVWNSGTLVFRKRSDIIALFAPGTWDTVLTTTLTTTVDSTLDGHTNNGEK